MISANGKYFASAGSFTDHTMKLWNAESGDSLWEQKDGDDDLATYLAFTAADTVLVSGHFGGSIRFWNVQSGKCLKTIQAHSGKVGSLSVDPTDKYLVSGCWDSNIKLWKLPSSVQVVP